MNVIKRDGTSQEWNIDKINSVLEWACKGLDASAEMILMNASIKVYDKIKTTKIHEVLINSTAEMISVESPDYQYVASRMLNYYLRKQIFGVFKDEDMPSVRSVLRKNIALGLYDSSLDSKFTDKEWEQIEKIIDHSKDSDITYASYKKLVSSYLIQNRHSGYVYETPQYCYLIFTLALFDDVKKIKEFYNEVNTKSMNISTPVLAGMRSGTKQYASCTLIEVGDSLESIFASVHAIGRFVAKRAGIGINISRLRSVDSPIRGGEAKHTGLIPFLKLFESATKSCSQGGIRDGSATTHVQIWNKEIEYVMVLKNNKGNDDNRVRKLDYSIQVSNLFWKRMTKNEPISLFSTYDVPGLIDVWGTKDFDKLYIKYENDETIPRKTVKGGDILLSMVVERMNTGRIYIQNIDNVNKYTPFLDKITMSNLCQEINLPTEPFEDVNSGEGEIALCMLGGINVGVLKGITSKDYKRLEKPLKMVVETLDKIIDIQEYPTKNSEKQKLRRSIGVGVTNYAYFLAKNNLAYGSQEALNVTDELFEHIQFYLLKASMELAKEYGACEWFNRTKYSKGQLPIDWYNKKIDKLVSRTLTCDWEWLRGEIATYGLRNSVLSAIMPSESSSVVTNSTNGIEPIKSLLIIKSNRNSKIPMLVPDAKQYKNSYTMAWDITNNKVINDSVAVMQKWVDQGISVNHYYNPQHYKGGSITTQSVMMDIINFSLNGGKQLYYANTNDMIFKDMTLLDDEDNNSEINSNNYLSNDEVGCEGGGCTL